MNPLAQELNEIIQEHNHHVYAMLSTLGKSLFFPKGILSQAAEAKKKATKYNATIGIATDESGPRYLPCIQQYIEKISPKDSYPYAPGAGKLQLRERWSEKLREDNPNLKGKAFSLPIVTSGLTHGLALAADMFIDPGDVIVLPDKFWENYSLLFGVRKGAAFRTFPLFTGTGGFNVDGFKSLIAEIAAEKDRITILLNFPNNPTGYTITPAEGEQIARVINDAAERGSQLVVIFDDAYFGLFYDDASLQESLFGKLVNLHPRILAVKLDGPTKEQFVWGFRVGFLTYGLGGCEAFEDIYSALEKKTMGAIRGGISNCSHLAQSIVLNALNAPTYKEERAEKVAVLKRRALKTQAVLKNEKYASLWEVYPFNSGYFMCLQLKNVEAEPLREHLLNEYGVGTIAMEARDLRITFSSIDEANIEEFFELVAQAVKDLQK